MRECSIRFVFRSRREAWKESGRVGFEAEAIRWTRATAGDVVWSQRTTLPSRSTRRFVGLRQAPLFIFGNNVNGENV